MLAWYVVCQEQGEQDHVLDECLSVCEMYGFSEASAVHLGVENDQKEGQEREEALQRDGALGDSTAPYASDERSTDDGLGKSEEDSQGLQLLRSRLQGKRKSFD